MSRYLANLHRSCFVIACDFSSSRLQQARDASSSVQNLKFDEQDLRALTYSDAQFDLVFSRFAVQHQTPEDATKVITEMSRVLKPGGTILIIDADGYLENLYPQTSTVSQSLRRFIGARKVDLHVGRKNPYLLAKAGFESVSWRTESPLFQGQMKEAEIDLMRARFEHAKSFFEEAIGGEEEFLSFQKEYLECMTHPQAVYFFTKFIVNAIKPFSSVVECYQFKKRTLLCIHSSLDARSFRWKIHLSRGTTLSFVVCLKRQAH